MWDKTICWWKISKCFKTIKSSLKSIWTLIDDQCKGVRCNVFSSGPSQHLDHRLVSQLFCVDQRGFQPTGYKIMFKSLCVTPQFKWPHTRYFWGHKKEDFVTNSTSVIKFTSAPKTTPIFLLVGLQRNVMFKVSFFLPALKPMAKLSILSWLSH